jgi:hypothetical protein
MVTRRPRMLRKTLHTYSSLLSVNKLRFHSIDNRTNTGEFFFNNSSLLGDDLLKQVILGYKIAGAQILGSGLDGTGINARLLKLIQNGKKFDKGQSWLDKDQVSFANPAYPSHRVAVFHYTTHNLKGSRNALLSSGPLLTKARRYF